MVEMTANWSGTSPGTFGAGGRTRAGGLPGPSALVPREREPEAPAVDDRGTCGCCGRRITRHEEQYAVLWDSSAIHPTEAGMDGRRLVAACGADHVTTLRATARPWVDEEFWAGRLARAERERPGLPELPHVLALRAEITVEQMQRALAWRQGHPGPDSRG
jgi:hypothetical protein